MPQLAGRKEGPVQETRQRGNVATSKHDPVISAYGPPKPPRLEKQTARKETSHGVFKCEGETAFEIAELSSSKLELEEMARIVEEQSRGPGDGRAAGGDFGQSQAQARRAARRREPRRHTLHNGVDYNLLKRMKQIEQEKDILLQGLSAVEDAREWYLKQLADVQDKMRYAGRMGAYVEPWSAASQERVELLRARVAELSRQLAAAWRGPLALHMNLALPHLALSARTAGDHASAPAPAPAALRSQNRMLAEEVNKKNERISVLEREKSALIRELLMQRNRTKMIDNFT